MVLAVVAFSRAVVRVLLQKPTSNHEDVQNHTVPNHTCGYYHSNHCGSVVVLEEAVSWRGG